MAKAAAETAFSEELARIESMVGSTGPLWLRRLQKTELARFRALGFRSTREEEWRQTNVAPIASLPYRRADGPGSISRADLEGLPFSSLDVPRIVFVDGHHAPELSHLDGFQGKVRVSSLARMLRDEPEAIEPHLARHAKHEDRAFVALNTALFADGACIMVEDDADVPVPLQIVHVVSTSDAPILTCAHPAKPWGPNRLTID